MTRIRLTKYLGWSLGGMLALQVAWIFSRDPKVEVDGIIMVESPFPDYHHVVDVTPGSPVSEDGPTLATTKLERSILQSVNMLHQWKPPVWRRKRQPYTIMLCATECLISADNPALCFIDQFRDSPTLGWAERASSVVVDKSYPIQGHHFSIFDPRNVSIDHYTYPNKTVANRNLSMQVASVTETIATVGTDMEQLAYKEYDDDE
jgi:thioesterase domain-containing protein